MKTKLTKEIEQNFIHFLYEKKYELAVIECWLGRYGIVDLLSYHGELISNGRGKPRTRSVTWRCYEVKSSKADFYSKHKWSFIGHYNYFVMPEELYDIVKQDIPKGIGCYVYRDGKFKSAKKASKAKLKVSDSQMQHDFLVSSARDARRWMDYKQERGD